MTAHFPMNLEKALMDKIYIISFTEKGAELSLKLQNIYHDALLYSKYPAENIKMLEKDIKSFTADIFKESKAVIFISAIGIAVRAVAPLIVSKDKDAAVIVIDDTGKYVIPVLSGHIGGANEMALKIAEYINAEPVITTATDRNNKFAVDVWAEKNNLYIDDITMIKEVSSRLLRNEKVGFISDYEVNGILPENVIADVQQECGIVIADNIDILPFPYTMQLIPKEYILGIGARKGAEYSHLKDLIKRVLKENNIDKRKILSIASIDIKKDEKAINMLAEELNVPFITYSKDELANVQGDFTSSNFVKNITGVDNVCERAVKCFCGSEIIVKKICENGFTLSIGFIKWHGSF